MERINSTTVLNKDLLEELVETRGKGRMTCKGAYRKKELVLRVFGMTRQIDLPKWLSIIKKQVHFLNWAINLSDGEVRPGLQTRLLKIVLTPISLPFLILSTPWASKLRKS
ncbi:hypothetical protein O9G_005996 [Rozella allomycis CSF55]|uniref:Uncharacterized protein n=1 Tax=Rozella allomycis (strain CSF55) TaxID=988480 RepID=A0A075AXY6_ROZAC|nr:hypothetical protein O9G_005996 [Rozella allomycis CSF55]|eukprot:EPZ35092.1 hypothetical protein O9G_005996 [Rozella allomycis CSF55]